MHHARSHTCAFRSDSRTTLVSAVLRFLIISLAPLTVVALADAFPSIVSTQTPQSHLPSPTQWGQGQQNQDQQNQSQHSQGQQSQGQQSQGLQSQGQQSPAVKDTTSTLRLLPSPSETSSTLSSSLSHEKSYKQSFPKIASSSSKTSSTLASLPSSETSSSLSPPCPPTKSVTEEAWKKGSITWAFDVKCCALETSWTIVGPRETRSNKDYQAVGGHHFFVEILYAEMEKNDSLNIFSVDVSTDQRIQMMHDRSSDDTAFSPILVPSSTMTIEVKTRDQECGKSRSSRFSLTYTAVQWNRKDRVVMESVYMYRCQGVDKLPQSITCDGIRHCEKSEDETNCAYLGQGCGSWFPFRGKCFEATFNTVYSEPVQPQTACREDRATLATLQEPGAISMAAALIRKSGFKSAAVGIFKAKPLSDKVRHLYRFVWQWSPGHRGGPMAYEQQKLQRDGIMLDCAVLDVSEVIRPVPCNETATSKEYVRGNYICMRTNPAQWAHTPAPFAGSLPVTTTLPSKFPVKKCPDGSFVQVFYRCPPEYSGQPRNDIEWSPNNFTLFKCGLHESVHYMLVCDGNKDCQYSWMDKTDCSPPQLAPLRNLSFFCDDLRAIPKGERCNGVHDCFDGSDEKYCSECGAFLILSPGPGERYCVPRSYYRHFEKYLTNTTVERKDEERCLTCQSEDDARLPHVPSTQGTVVLDRYGMSSVVGRDSCGDGFYHCMGSFCIPSFLMNNGEKDCPQGDDESFRPSVTCPGYYRCQASERLNVCVHDDFLCDGIYHCPNRDDELFCNVTCPRDQGCECEGHAYRCSSMIDPLRNLYLRYLDVSHARNVSLENIHFMEYLFFLNLSSCGLDNVTLVSMPGLRTLDLSNNLLTQLDSRSLDKFIALRYLDLSKNPLLKSVEIASIPYLEFLNLSFCTMDNVTVADLYWLETLDLSNNLLTQLNLSKLAQLQHLNISNNPLIEAVDSDFSQMLNHGELHDLKTLIMTNVGLNKIDGKGFSYLSKLLLLDIRMNAVHSYTKDSLCGLTDLKELYTDETNLCCSYFHATLSDCYAPVNELSSCSDLLGQNLFRVCLWSLSMLAVLGNAGVFVYRLFVKQTTAPSSQILVKTLCVSDLLMGVYMMMIGVADAQVRGVYVAKENEWKNSMACTVAGFLSFVSSEVSVFVVCLITLDRVLVICFPLNSRLHWSFRTAFFACCVVWLAGIFLAIVPLLVGMEFYGQNGICIPLPITRKKFSGQSYAFGVFIVLNFVIFIIIGLGQAFIYRAIHSSRKAAGSQQSKQDVTIARRLLIIVLSDFCCWFPIGLTGLLAASGTPIPGEVNVWAAIFVLPLNSALNPFLYTLSGLREKREKARIEREAQKVLEKLPTEIPKLPQSKKTELARILVQSRLVEDDVLFKMMGGRPCPENVDTGGSVSLQT